MGNAAALIVFGVLFAASLPRQQPAANAPGPLTPQQNALFADAGRAFAAKRYAEALTKFQTLHTQVPGNSTIAKFAAEAAVNTGDFTTAAALLQPVLAAAPEDPQALGIQVHLFGQQHDGAQRDAALAHMQTLHDSGSIKLESVIVEQDPTPSGGSVRINYFLEPWSRFHIALMATFFDAAGKQTSRIALESDDIDQVSFAKEHPQEAAAGQRVYSTDSYSETRNADGKVTGGTHGTLCWTPGCFFIGRPSYELFREHVLAVRDTPAKPISTTTTGEPTPHP